ncbi:electron transfer flavoprotein beta subunit [Humitalea rosea]|uniref:Electron transfer flavoprotein beta subunit n=1 Tax=Humitalea rosea TaxID=990373 RepID=A0A2W7IWK7_9PROT|nr:electron transfer flavoprotein subunit beta [Humitalea rosea]PZW50902.1 electron transfer flavoprotein beta subunit [Humitalea rosea]
MQVVVLLAGVVDPKWRLGTLGLRPGTAQVEDTALPRKLSPFDEAALETALQLRDADAAVTVTAILTGGAESDGLLRAVAAFRPHRAFRFGDAAMSLWDPATAARLLGAAVRAATEAPALVLMGREFGDSDDGVLAPALAEAEGWAFCGLAHRVALRDGDILLHRTRGARDEILHRRPPAVVSITNERGNRLRHPLMKNVMLARRAPVEVVAPPTAPPPALALRAIAAVPPAQRGGAGRVLTGPVAAQVEELAAYLRASTTGAA